MKTKIILISGKAESGKDTFADQLISCLNKNYIVARYAFADKLKKIAKKEFNWNGEKDKKGRRLLQIIGELYRLAFNKDHWIYHVFIKMENDCPDIAVITDCRYVNESKWFKENGYEQMIIKIDRNGHENKLTRKQKQHKSEKQVDEIDEDFRFSCSSLEENSLAAEFVARIIERRW